MRVSCLLPVALTLAIAVPALAQVKEWGEFADRDDHFTVNFPGDPAKSDLAYKTAKGTTLPAHVYSASDPRGTYSITVVNYATAAAEQGTAIAEAAAAERKKGKPRYDEAGNIDRIKTWRMSVELPDGRIQMSEIMFHQGRLYISEANVALKAPPPAQFQASLQVLDDDGVRIRYNQDGVTRQR
jgi:catechol 2,3-dioxygenase-like lactoylglutathione lyase family enzyme